MDYEDRIKIHDDFASEYDKQVKQYNSYGHEVLFGMCYEFVKPDETILDLGIGTGLSSVLFAKAGLKVYGIDGSSEMLKVCKLKVFARELKQYDIQNVPLPHPDNFFSHILSCGVFHFFGDIQPILKDAHRIIKESGIFAFTIASLAPRDIMPDIGDMPEYIEIQSAWGVPIFKHSDKYIHRITKAQGFKVHKEQKILADSGVKDADDILFKAIVTQKITS